MRWGALVAVAVLSGCLPEDRLVACPDDLLCPVDSVCDTAHGGCVTQDQATVCLGAADHAPCTAGAVFGYCLDQICIDPGCGNFVLEPGELCDDGNRNDNDGCSSTCTSQERCGDGALDLALGEQCDDGNLQSHDGCDSRCVTETAVWSADQIGPASGDAHHMTFDPVRGKAVVFSDGYVWGWDGARWAIIGSGGPTLHTGYAVAFDESRGTLVVVAAEPNIGDIIVPDPVHDQLYEWDGQSWRTATAQHAPACATLALIYDPVRHAVFGVGAISSGGAVFAQLDVATGAWTALPAPVGNMDYGYDVAVDTARQRIVVAMGGSFVPSLSPTVHEWTGTQWLDKAAQMAAPSGWSLLYDPKASRVLAIAGGASSNGDATPVQSWDGGAWTSLPDAIGPRAVPAVAFDTVRNVRVAFGGGFGAQDDVIESAAGPDATWTQVARTAPPEEILDACAFDEAGARLVCVGSDGDAGLATWAWAAGTWTKLFDDPSLPAPLGIAYDPVRGTVVGVTAGLRELRGDAWVEAPTTPMVTDFARAITWDPVARQIVAIQFPGFQGPVLTTRISPDNTVTTFASDSYSVLAFDARNHDIVGAGGNNTAHLVGNTWSPIVGPGAGYQPVENARRGTVEFIAPGRPAVERIGATWVDQADAPPIPVTGIAAYDQATGELVIVGNQNGSRFMLHRRWESATPFEACAATDEADADADGDGLSGCDDPDCWARCTPACPPLASCP